MYTLYYLPDACSLATQTILHELDQPVELINVQQLADFTAVNPTGMVPLLVDNSQSLREGAAIILHLLEKHPNTLLPAEGTARTQAIEDILFANATMHPAYGRLFFIAQHIADEAAKHAAFAAAAGAIANLWQVVEQRLVSQPFLGGDQVSAADIMLTVYARWGAHFPVDIPLGPNTRAMLDNVMALPSFQRALSNEQQDTAA